MKHILTIILILISLVSFSQVSVTLDGSASSDSDGTISAYLWRQVSGNVVTITNATTARPTIFLSVAGVYKFGLIVTDNQGLKSIEDTVQVTILPAPIKPKANAGPDQIISLPVAMRFIKSNKDVAWLRRRS